LVTLVGHDTADLGVRNLNHVGSADSTAAIGAECVGGTAVLSGATLAYLTADAGRTDRAHLVLSHLDDFGGTTGTSSSNRIVRATIGAGTSSKCGSELIALSASALLTELASSILSDFDDCGLVAAGAGRTDRGLAIEVAAHRVVRLVTLVGHDTADLGVRNLNHVGSADSTAAIGAECVGGTAVLSGATLA